MIFKGRILVSLILLFYCPIIVQSGICVKPITFCQAFGYYSSIITGKVTETRDYKAFREYKISISSIIKGKGQKIISVISFKKGLCTEGPELINQQLYLLYITDEGSLNSISYGMFAPKLLDEAGEDITQLKKISSMSLAKRKSCSSLKRKL